MSHSNNNNYSFKPLSLILKKVESTNNGVYKIISPFSSSSSSSSTALSTSSTTTTTANILSDIETVKNECNNVTTSSIDMNETKFNKNIPACVESATSSSAVASASVDTQCYSPASTSNSIDQIIDKKPFEQNNSIVNEELEKKISCEFCNKVGKQNGFKGRFCSKVCVGRFAQK